MRRVLPWLPVLLAACGGLAGGVPEPDTDTTASPGWPAGVWNPSLPATRGLSPGRGLVVRRAAVHVHAPWSHDACDGAGWVDGVIDEACHAALWTALCDAAYDVAFVTDHPDYGDRVDVRDRWPAGAVAVEDAQGFLGVDVPCADGRAVHARAGFEDALMPVGVRRAVDPDPAVAHALLNRTDAAAFAAMQQAGAFVMMAHTEGKAREDLVAWQDLGLHGVEVYNVHAAFAPNIRRDDLGLPATGWIDGIGPFVQQAPGLEPDLLFLAVLTRHDPSLAHWDALLARGPMMPTFGSDAHENVLNAPLADGERVDSYRRVLRWGSTHLLARGEGPADITEALASRRAYVAIEILGTPAGFDVHLASPAGVVEMGDTGAPGTLVVGCPTLADGSPRGTEAPDISVRVLRDGAVWQTGCGEFAAGPGVYRVEVDIVPHHLAPFLGDSPAAFIRSVPWLYSGAIRVEEE